VGRPESRSTGCPHSGDLLGSVLYSYKINWQTVLFAGCGESIAGG
jgi:hypothetical protein